MQSPEINWDVCEECTPCLASAACKTRAIIQIDIDEPPYIEHARCTFCGLCVDACPHSAIEMNGPHIPKLTA